MNYQSLKSEDLLKSSKLAKFDVILGQTNLISGSTDFFQNLKGRSVGKKRKIKKKSPIFCIVFDYQ